MKSSATALKTVTLASIGVIGTVAVVSAGLLATLGAAACGLDDTTGSSCGSPSVTLVWAVALAPGLLELIAAVTSVRSGRLTPVGLGFFVLFPLAVCLPFALWG